MRTPTLAVLALAGLLAACGGSGGTSNGTPTQEPLVPAIEVTSLSGPAVAGMRVVACGNGVTCVDAISSDDGLFTMVVGGTLDLYVGPLKVLTARDTSEAITSVMAFSATGNEDDPTFINQMTLLYSLDSDANPDNGIQISEEAHDVMATLPFGNLRFDVAPDVFVSNTVLQTALDAINAVDDAPGVSLTVRDPAAVKETLKRLAFDAKWGGNWSLQLDDSAGSSVSLNIADDGTVTVGSDALTFKLEVLPGDEANMRFSSPAVGSFIGKIKADGSGRGTWSRLGDTASAGFWTARRGVAAP